MDIASLSLEVKSDQVKSSTVALREMVPAASAAERAAQRWGMSTNAAAKSSEEFSKRVQRTIKDLEFERQQLTRNAAEQQRYAMLRRAGVSASSAEGQAISASIAALQAQKSALKGTGETAAITTTAVGGLLHLFGPLVAALGAASVAHSIWDAGMKAANLGEQAEQVGLTTDQLQAYRLAAVQAGIETEQLDGAMVKLAKAMGAANEGNDEMIDRFQKMGVKLLDVNGELRKPADILPELSRGLLGVSSETERNALMMQFMGKSGTKLVTMLETWANGNGALIASAKAANAVMNNETIKAWDDLDDQIKVTKAQWDTFAATLAAPLAIGGLQVLVDIMKTLQDGMRNAGILMRALSADVPQAARDAGIALKEKELANLDTLRNHPARAGADQSKIDARRAAVQAELDALKAAPRTDSSTTPGIIGPEPSRQGGYGSGTEGSIGTRQPVGDKAKKAGESAAETYRKLIEGTNQYVAAKDIETQSLGMNAGAAARLKHEQELLGKVANDNLKLAPQEIEALKQRAAAMAEADDRFKNASFMKDFKDNSEEVLADQALQQQAVFMSVEAADSLRISTEALNAARQAGIDLTPAQIDSIQQTADAMASAKEKTRQMTDLVGFGKDVFKGFFSDMRQGLMNGQTAWEAFGNAAVNVLNRIAEKLLEMAATKLFEAAFGGSSGGGGLGGLLGGLFGGGGTATDMSFVSGGSAGSGGFAFAKGGAFNRGNVIPFANGGIVNRPTFFPMANGAGLMGEAGPEAVMPLRRGPGGRLGVSAHGGRENSPQSIIISVEGDTDLVRVTARDEAGKVVAVAAPKIIGSAVKQSREQVVPTMARHQAESGGDYRVGG